MASWRKVENREAPQTAPVSLGGTATDTTPAPQDARPQEAAPRPEETITPQSPHEETNPAEKAAQSAIKERLAETERAAAMEREAIAQQPQYAESQPHESPTTEQIIASTQLPERAKRWLREHSDFISDPSKNATIIALHDVAKRQAGSEWTDMYFEKMENLLGIRPAPQTNSGNRTSQQSTPRNSAPVRQQYSGPAVSAPPHRDVPSMGSGRPQSFRAPLTAEEREVARASRISDAEYQHQKEKIARENAAGVRRNG
jgi:hypothetical protein